MRRRVAAARVGRLATITPGGEPRVVPCCFALADETIVSAVDAKPKSTPALARLDNIRAHPVASLLVDEYDEDWSHLWWVRVDGAARVIESGPERERAIDRLVDKYEQYRAVRPPGAVLELTISSWRSWPQ